MIGSYWWASLTGYVYNNHQWDGCNGSIDRFTRWATSFHGDIRLYLTNSSSNFWCLVVLQSYYLQSQENLILRFENAWWSLPVSDWSLQMLFSKIKPKQTDINIFLITWRCSIRFVFRIYFKNIKQLLLVTITPPMLRPNYGILYFSIAIALNWC